MKSIGIIGYGRFGEVLHRQLRGKYPVEVYEPHKKIPGIKQVSMETVCKNELIILAVPVAHVKSVAQQTAKYIKTDSIIQDVCAVKEYPLFQFRKYYPDTQNIVGSHPLFGPDSVTNGLKNHLMILIPDYIKPGIYQKVKDFWQTCGLTLIEMSAEEQDRLMAWTLALTHFLGRGLNSLPLPDTAVATRDYQNLMALIIKINRDTEALFYDMHRYNPYAAEMREKLVESIAALKSRLDEVSGDTKDELTEILKSKNKSMRQTG